MSGIASRPASSPSSHLSFHRLEHTSVLILYNEGWLKKEGCNELFPSPVLNLVSTLLFGLGLTRAQP